MSDQNVQVIQEAYAAFGRGDIAAILANLTDDVEWFLPGEGLIPQSGLYRGPDGVGSFFSKLAATTEFEAFEPREFIAQDDRVVACGYYRARSKATGRKFEADWAMVFTFRNGKIAKYREYGDTAVIAAAYQVAAIA